jgi:hypothetical protein
MTLSVSTHFALDARYVKALDLTSPLDELIYVRRIDLASGIGANQADLLWHDQRTLAASGTEDLDLAGGLTDAFGTALTMVKVKELVVCAAAGNTNDVQVTRPAANGVPLFLAASDGIAVPPGGMIHLQAPGAAGVAVTAGTGDLITVTNGGAGTSVTYDVVIIGTSA